MGAIVESLSELQFIDRFKKIRPDNFSDQALIELYNYYTDVSEGIGEVIEFDPILICVEWTEYDTEKEVLDEYSLESIEDLHNSTVLIPIQNGGYLVQNF